MIPQDCSAAVWNFHYQPEALFIQPILPLMKVGSQDEPKRASSKYLKVTLTAEPFIKYRQIILIH
jgi:hypothetical protein